MFKMDISMEDIAVDSIMEAVIDRSIDSIDLGDIENYYSL